ncbi:hypothetical protein DFH08DRAFT_807333 [Mycena albidolilacea]|uniref:Uncharacterized protein n=1 Tax=Mycena albidolilacea TaxID=1033008 RepID=A0AAD7EV28_9AGAR|nr:hypothetical protein DFH08DRAFT_807333 [Mycena albidolilacea]
MYLALKPTNLGLRLELLVTRTKFDVAQESLGCGCPPVMGTSRKRWKRCYLRSQQLECREKDCHRVYQLSPGRPWTGHPEWGRGGQSPCGGRSRSRRTGAAAEEEGERERATNWVLGMVEVPPFFPLPPESSTGLPPPSNSGGSWCSSYQWARRTFLEHCKVLEPPISFFEYLHLNSQFGDFWLVDMNFQLPPPIQPPPPGGTKGGRWHFDFAPLTRWCSFLVAYFPPLPLYPNGNLICGIFRQRMYKATYIEAENRLQNTASVNTGCSDASELTPDPRWTTRTLGHDHERAPHVVQRTHGRRRELHVQRLLRGVEVLPHASSSIESSVGATVDTVDVFVGSDNAGSNRGGDAGDGMRRAPALRPATRWGRLGVVGVVAGHFLGREGISRSPRRASIFMVAWFAKRVMAGGREVSQVEVGEEGQDA